MREFVIALFVCATLFDFSAAECDREGQCALPQHSTSVLQAAKLSTSCNPCIVNETFYGIQLTMKIYSKKKSGNRSLILSFHGKNAKIGNSVCKFVDSDGDLVCAHVLNEYYGKDMAKELKVTEVALKYLTQHAGEYAIDTSKIFLYGYSRGGIHLGKFMTNSADRLRDQILGLVIDSGTPNNYWSDLKENGKVLPPILMLHCELDTAMKPKKTINPGIKNIDRVNNDKKRAKADKVKYHYMKYTADSRCKHNPPRVRVPSGIAAVKRYIDQTLSIYDGNEADPFEGIADEVIEPESGVKR